MTGIKPVQPVVGGLPRTAKATKRAALCGALVLLSGCASNGGIYATSLSSDDSANPAVPDHLMQVSRAVKRNFLYNNDRPMVWPPVKNIDGIVVGNCMTYSRMVQTRLKALGLASRFRNVLAPVFPREHVVTVVTDRAGRDWVFDNRRPRPFPISQLSHYYDFEPGTHNAYVGAQRRTWRSVKTVKP